MGNTIGYIQVYFRLDCGDLVAYAKYDSDFSNEITIPVIEQMKANIKDFYQSAGFPVRTVETCTKEEYEEKSGSPMAESHWSGDDIQVTVHDGGKDNGENKES